jgi:hypothetical protein
MARICPGCNKFASIDDGADVEVENEAIDGDELTVEVTVPLVSQCCNETMATLSMEAVLNLEDAHGDGCKAVADSCDTCGGDGTVEAKCQTCGGSGIYEAEEDGSGRVDCPDCDGTGKVEEDCSDCDGMGTMAFDDEAGGERYEVVGNIDATFYSDQDTYNSKGKPIAARYRRTYYGAEIEATVRCTRCEEEFTVTDTVREQASSFEDY